MKKLLTFFIMTTMIISVLTGCGNATSSNIESGSNVSQEETTDAALTEDATIDNVEETTSEAADDTSGSSADKILVAYYSASGNTKDVAQYIADHTGADLFEMVPQEVYTNADLDWTNRNSRVSVEHDNEDKRDVPLVAVTPDNFGEYDVVYIGYPIWWGIAAWPVNEFVTSNDFTGKTVIPFCTSTSSGLGESGELLEEMSGTGNWLEGQRFRSGVSEEDVTDWVDGLSY